VICKNMKPASLLSFVVYSCHVGCRGYFPPIRVPSFSTPYVTSSQLTEYINFTLNDDIYFMSLAINLTAGASASEALSLSSIYNAGKTSGISLDFSAVNSIDSPKPNDMTSVLLSLSSPSNNCKAFNDFFVDTTQNTSSRPGMNVNSLAGLSGQIPANVVNTMCW